MCIKHNGLLGAQYVSPIYVYARRRAHTRTHTHTHNHTHHRGHVIKLEGARVSHWQMLLLGSEG